MTGRSLTLSAKSASNFLAARDLRQEALERAWRAGQPAAVSCIVFLSLNIPGAEKNPPGVEGLFLALHHALLTAIPQALEIERTVDILGRIGGEEFAVLLPETDSAYAIEVAERLRENIAQVNVPLEGGQSVKFSVSIGVSSMASVNDSIGGLLGRADTALYEAKHRGRNRVCTRLS